MTATNVTSMPPVRRQGGKQILIFIIF